MARFPALVLDGRKLVAITRQEDDVRHGMQRAEECGLLGRVRRPRIRERVVCPERRERHRRHYELEHGRLVDLQRMCRGSCTELRDEVADLAEPVVQRRKLLVTQHGVQGGILGLNVRPVSPGIHDEERCISVTEVVVVLPLFRRVEVSVCIIQRECIGGIREGLLGAVPLPYEIVDDLYGVSDRT